MTILSLMQSNCKWQSKSLNLFLIGFSNKKLLTYKKLVHAGIYLEDFLMGYENLKRNWMAYEFLGEKLIFPSDLVLGINNDQTLTYDQVERIDDHTG